jgi:hypothetical protein
MSGKRKASGKPAEYTVGKNKPPQEHQIKPGEVRNRWGRGGKPKAEQTKLLAELPSQRMFLEEGTRLVRVRSGEETEELPTSQVVMRALAAEAMKPGNIFAKREYLRRLDHVEAIEFAHRREIFEYWSDRVAKAKAQIERANAAGEPEPRILPHPDDVQFDYTELTVRIVGPVNEAEAARSDRIVRLKELMYEMAIYDGPDVQNDPDTPLGQRWINLWMLFYIQMEYALPPRQRGVSDACKEAVYLRTVGFSRKRRVYLEERFAAEGIPFFLIGGSKESAFRLDELMEQAGYEGGWGSWVGEAP